jgi:hypothetical protein
VHRGLENTGRGAICEKSPAAVAGNRLRSSTTMAATPTRRHSIEVPPELRELAATALLLERLDRTRREASAEQYRGVVQRAAALLEQAEPGPVLDQLLDASPALAELWENRHYATSGLCRAPLEAAMNAELEAGALLKRLRAV